MPALTLRLPPDLAAQLDLACHNKGYKKTGLILRLIRDFLGSHPKAVSKKADSTHPFSKIVGIVSLGGDAVEDSDAPFE